MATKSKKINKYMEISIVALSIIWTYFLLFVIFRDFSIYSDNFYYADAFEQIRNEQLVAAFRYFVWRTGGTEPAFFLLFYVATHVLTYEFFVFVTGIFLYSSFGLFLVRSGTSLRLALLSMATNYYLIVLLVGVHRVKLAFAVLFFLLAMNQQLGRFKILMVPPFFHFQMFAYGVAYLFGSFMTDLARHRVRKSSVLIAAGFVLGVGLSTMTSELVQNFVGRLDVHLIDFAVALLLSIVYCWFFRIRDIESVSMLLAISLIVGLLGAFRMNMMLYFAFLMLLLLKRKSGVSIFIFVSSIYFVPKIITLYYQHYLSNLITTG